MSEKCRTLLHGVKNISDFFALFFHTKQKIFFCFYLGFEYTVCALILNNISSPENNFACEILSIQNIIYYKMKMSVCFLHFYKKKIRQISSFLFFLLLFRF